VTAGDSPESSQTALHPRPPGKQRRVRLMLYLAGATPNSLRAEANLDAALIEAGVNDLFDVEYIDVLLDTKRASTDSVIVTPTLVAAGAKNRLVIIGDLGELGKLHAFLRTAAKFE
jgi:hypothetical protein